MKPLPPISYPTISYIPEATAATTFTAFATDQRVSRNTRAGESFGRWRAIRALCRNIDVNVTVKTAPAIFRDALGLVPLRSSDIRTGLALFTAHPETIRAKV